MGSCKYFRIHTQTGPYARLGRVAPCVVLAQTQAEPLRYDAATDHFVPISWDEAFARAGAALRGRVQNALAILDGHTCHDGHTDALHLALHLRVGAEIQTALDLTRPAP
jgi:hypothetical protein